MLRFTTAHKIPFNIQTPVNNYVFSTVIGQQIWIICEQLVPGDTPIIELAVFDTKTHEYTVLNCKLPHFSGFLIHSITSNRDQLYITFTSQVGHVFSRTSGPLFLLKIFKFDTKTLTYSHVHDFHANVLGPPQIVGNYMYFLNCIRSELTRTNRRVFPRSRLRRRRRRRRISQIFHEIREYQLIKIDLSASDVVNTTDLLVQKPGEWYRNLLVNNERLYLFGEFEEKYMISMIDNDNRIVPIFETAKYENSSLITKWYIGGLIDTTYFYGPILFFNTFDFDASQWNKQIIENPWDKFFKTEFRTAELIDNTLFAVVVSRPHHHPDKRKCAVRVLQIELKPKLSSICLLRLVNDLLTEGDSENVDSVVESLSIPMRPILENMVEWRMSLMMNVI